MAMKWWGWGEEGRTFQLPAPERFWAFVHARLGETRQSQRVESLDRVKLRPSRLSAEALEALGRAAGGECLSDGGERATHSLGKGYRDLVRMRRGEVPNPTDAVVYPQSEGQVAAVLDAARKRDIAVIPFGGGTSVVGGVEPEGEGPVVTLDLGRMNRVLRVDRVAHTALVEAGVLGPSLEAQLNAEGFTLGHFPQSFEFSSLGGWIATRSAGHNSTLYGKIEDRVQSARLLFPGGELTTPQVPAAAAGPDLAQLVTGSEGILGVITQATMRLSPVPAQSDYRGYLFPSFEAGIEAAREIMQSELRPAILRLSDEAETEVNIAMQGGPEGVRAGLLIVGFAGEEDRVSTDWQRAEPILARQEGRSLGSGPGEAWERSRYELPYLRDTLLDHAILVDTLETATTWGRYLSLYRSVQEALAQALGDRGLVMAHLSHSYPDGASVYYTFLAPQTEGRELEQWEAAKSAATQAIVDGGGALSHHHGIGVDHRPWMGGYVGPGGMRALAALKQVFDPQGIMNPGKLMPPGEEARDV